ncbi:hypothetical protein B0O99DRAFT_688258 [Bisporella sp. PMI_857]|nr:hypothetical protein B0O99DRAFT_688258 [Bisporella sp. PMI_857]
MVNYQENVLARRGLDGRAHIPALPFWVAIIRVFQLLLAVVVLGCSAYAYHTFNGDEISGYTDIFRAYSFSFFAFSWTILFILYIFVTPLFLPKFYLYWAHIVLEALTLLWWMVTFALFADMIQSSWWKYYESLIDSASQLEDTAQDYGYSYGSNSAIDSFKAAIGTTKAALALSVINWVLFIVTLVALSIYVNKHRKEQGESGFAGISISRNKQPGDVEAAQQQEKIVHQQPVELTNVQQYPQQQYPQQPYPQQPYPQQPTPVH